MKRPNAYLLSVVLLLMLLSGAATAGLSEGLAAYKRKDYQTALREFKPLGAEGNSKAQVMGLMFNSGFGVPQDLLKAVELFRLASDHGDPEGQRNLGRMYFGRGIKRDVEEAVRLYRLSANQGDVEAQSMLGYLYQSGDDMQHDYAESLKWYRLSANQGSADGIYEVGKMYHKGLGVDVSRVIAFATYERSAFIQHDPIEGNPAVYKVKSIQDEMTPREIAAGRTIC